MQIYRVAILGCRSRGTAAALAYNAHPRTEIVGLCDLQSERLTDLGTKIGVEAQFTDLDDMMRNCAPDIVAIPTGTEWHWELALRVLDYGSHIDIEKPLAIDCRQADEIITRATKKNALVAVHHQGRVGVHMRALCDAYASGRIGELRHIHGHGKAYYGGYGLMNIGTHMINNMLAFTSRCSSVVASGLTDGRLIEPSDVVPSPSGMGTIAGEHLTATLHFDDNITATLLQHRFPSGTNPVMEFCGTEGRLVLGRLVHKGDTGALFLPRPHYTLDIQGEPWEVLEPVYPTHYDHDSDAHPDDYRYVDDYVAALDEGREHTCSGKDGHHVVEIMMAIFEAAATGHRVHLPQHNRDHPLLRWRQDKGLAPPESMPRPYAEWLAAEDRRLGRTLRAAR